MLLFRFEFIGKLVSINKRSTIKNKKIKGRLVKVICNTKEYNQLLKDLFYLIKAEAYTKIHNYDKKVDMILEVCRQSATDTNNIEKPIGDSLKNAGILIDDKLIKNTHYIRSYHKKGELDKLIVELWEPGDITIIKRGKNEKKN